jgi:hypothetical protein
MEPNKYSMSGGDGELFLAVNGFVLCYAEKFTAVLNEHLKSYSFRGQKWTLPENYTAKIMLRGLTSPDPDIVRKIAADTSTLDFEFRGFYKSKNGFNYPIGLHKLFPVNGDLDDFLSGYVNEWEFSIGSLNDSLINEFKKAY